MGIFDDESDISFPLRWPVIRPRSTEKPKRAKFGQHDALSGGSKKLTVAVACERLANSVRRLGAKSMFISSNVPLNANGWPMSSAPEPDDPAVAIYFPLNGATIAICCDKWDRVADNLAAIAADIEANRARQRWGVVSIDEAFAGFAALPEVPQAAPKPAWWQVLGFSHPPQGYDALRDRYRELAREHHPDRGGSADRMIEITEAYEEGKSFMDGYVKQTTHVRETGPNAAYGHRRRHGAR